MDRAHYSTISALMLTIVMYMIWSGSVMPGSTSQSELTLINECTCPGFNLTFRCTVFGSVGATVWRGSAIECPEINDELTFLHLIRFMDIRGCNGGAIIGKGIEINDMCYTSQVNITVDSSMNGRSIECIYNNGTFANLIGNSSVTITSDPFPPPHDITTMVTGLNSPELTFEWNPVSLNCLALHYIILFDCGICPTTTINTIAVCTEIQLDMSNCTFTIQTNVCNSLTGDVTQIPLVLKVPKVPVVHVTPLYSHMTNQLSSLQVEVYEVERFYISDGLDGSPVSHTVTYTNAASGITCDSAKIPASSCINYVCRHRFNVSQTANCQNSLVTAADVTDLIVSVLSTNVLGNGPSDNISIGFMNTKVEVIFNSDITRAVCKFLIQVQNQNADNRYYCSISYEPINSNHNGQQRIFGTSQNSIVDLNFPQGSVLPGTHHFIVNATATDILNTILIVGTFEKQKSKSQFTVNGLVFGVSIGAMGLLILIITAVLTAVLIRSRIQASKLITTAEHPMPDEQSSHEATLSQPEQSSTAIDTEQNVAYISLADAR